MPSVKVFPSNAVEFVDTNGDPQAEFTYDINSGVLELTDSGGSTTRLTGGFSRVDVTSQSVVADPYESMWVDTAAAGGNVTVTLPPDGGTIDDGDRVEIGVSDASNDVSVAANTGQTILGTPTTLSTVSETVTLEYNADTSEWMIR
jgi:hypothetical protein